MPAPISAPSRYVTPAELAQEMAKETGCSSCPEPVMSTLRNHITEAHKAVRDVKKLATLLKVAASALTQDALNALRALVNAIPWPLALQPTDILKYLTCPLTPVALIIDPSLISHLDPRTLLAKLRRQLADYIAEIEDNFEAALRQLQAWTVIKVVRDFVRACLRGVLANPLAIVEATTTCGLVAALCPKAYKGSVFEQFITDISTLDTAGIIPLPSDFAGPLKTAALLLGEAYTRIAAWTLVAGGGIPLA